MGKGTITSALLYAFFAAVGNGLFAFGQKKAILVEHPFIFILSSSAVGMVLVAVACLFLPKPDVSSFVRDNYRWVLLSGVGSGLTSIGFYFLYSRCGASCYVIYAVLSIVATSIVVGIIVFKESFNVYHFLSVVTAMATVVLFTVGQVKSS